MEVPSRPEREVGREQLEESIEGLFSEEIYAKRVTSLIGGVDGVLHVATLGIRPLAGLGCRPRTLAEARDQVGRPAALQYGARPESLFRYWAGFVLA